VEIKNIGAFSGFNAYNCDVYGATQATSRFFLMRVLTKAHKLCEAE